MGKKIIIKGADFSQNCVNYTETLYLSVYTDHGGGERTPNAANGGWAFGTASTPYAGLVNKTINFVRFESKQVGTLNFYRCTDPTDSSTFTLVTSVLITSTDKQITHVFEPVTLGNEYFVIGEANVSQGLPGYHPSDLEYEWIGKVPSANISEYTFGGIGIDVGYILQQ